MSRIRSARFLIILLLVTVVSAPAAWATPLRQPSGASSIDIVARAWSTVAALWAKAGCIIDPHGLCVATPPPTLDEGCVIDPHGGCAAVKGFVQASPPTEAGCILDPHGVCVSGN